MGPASNQFAIICTNSGAEMQNLSWYAAIATAWYYFWGTPPLSQPCGDGVPSTSVSPPPWCWVGLSWNMTRSRCYRRRHCIDDVVHFSHYLCRHPGDANESC